MRLSLEQNTTDFNTEVRSKKSSSEISRCKPQPSERDSLLQPSKDTLFRSYTNPSKAATEIPSKGIRESRTSKSSVTTDHDPNQNSVTENSSGHMAMGRGDGKSSDGKKNYSSPRVIELVTSGGPYHRDTQNSTDSAYDSQIENDNASRASQSMRSNRSMRSLRSTRSNRSNRSERSRRNIASAENRYAESMHQYYNDRANRILSDGASDMNLLDVPAEIYAVRRAALTVLHPLTHTWLVITIGFSTAAAFGMARFSRLLPSITYFTIFMPAWLSHLGLLCCHILSARALSFFISDANDNRQRPNTTDHLDRTEYLPLLQRSLKFGLKTGILSFFLFIFEVLLYRWLAHGHRSLTRAMSPIWIIVAGGILDGIICKTQNFVRLFAWLSFSLSLMLLCLRFDLSMFEISWTIILFPLLILLCVLFVSLVYIVNGHRIGYFRLTESQVAASVLYTMGSASCFVLAFTLSQLEYINNIDKLSRVLISGITPLSIALVGLGAWAVSRDEFEKLLEHGGQSAVHPKKLKLEAKGWTSVDSKGVSVLPFLGEVSYVPLDASYKANFWLCPCFVLYPYEEEANFQGESPYLPTVTSNASDRNIV